MRYGTVINYFPEKGFGFIKPDAGNDIFFHISTLGEVDPQLQIDPGQAVQYELEPRRESELRHKMKHGLGVKKHQQPMQVRATVVELIDRIPGATLEDENQRQQAARHPRALKRKPTWRR